MSKAIHFSGSPFPGKLNWRLARGLDGLCNLDMCYLLADRDYILLGHFGKWEEA